MNFMFRSPSASRLQLRLAGGKSLLGINSVRSARQAACASCVPHPVTVDNHSAIHLYEQTLLQGHAGHFRYRGGRKRCPPPTASTLTGASDGDCQKKVNCRTAFRLAAAIAPRRRKKPVRRQFRPLGEAVCALKPVQPSWITELVPGDY